MKALEDELIDELQKQHEEFSYEIEKRRIRFEENIVKRHKEMAKDLVKYIADSPIKNILSAPIIWA
ncbi:MAG: hypothetical protein ACU83O_02010, partial [Gammaproteobacteria bacterium]